MQESTRKTVSMADVARILGISYNSVKNRVRTGTLIPDFIIPANTGEHHVYRFYEDKILELLKLPQVTIHGQRKEMMQAFRELEQRVIELEKKCLSK